MLSVLTSSLKWLHHCYLSTGRGLRHTGQQNPSSLIIATETRVRCFKEQPLLQRYGWSPCLKLQGFNLRALGLKVATLVNETPTCKVQILHLQEARYDFLEVNDISFSGQIGPENVVPEGVIKWTSATGTQHENPQNPRLPRSWAEEFRGGEI